MSKYQLGALMAFAAAEGIRLQHCKPHGALYNMAGKDMDLALAIAEAIAEVDKNIILLGLANSKMIDAGKQLGLRVANEVFADRAYQADGSLVPRKLPGAVIHDKDEAIARTVPHGHRGQGHGHHRRGGRNRGSLHLCPR